MKVLLSAFACKPDQGSEPEVGFQTLLAAARNHDVWILTSDHYLPYFDAWLAGTPNRDNITVLGAGWDISDEAMHRLGRGGFHLRYDRWQRRAAEVAVALDRKVDFDLVHHVTLATYWGRAGVAAVEKPFVWGPVGGGVSPPLRLMPEIGWRGLPGEIARTLNRRVLGSRPTIKDTIRSAAVALAQNEATARQMRHARNIRVLPNGLCVDAVQVAAPADRVPDVILAARLLAWKGGTLALRAFRHVQHPRARLRIFGVGPEEDRWRRRISRWGLEDRVTLEGRAPRPALLAVIAGASALLHPSLHEEGGVVVAEALSLGTPVVCLAHGGPAELVDWWPGTPSVAVRPGSPEATARRLAAVLDEVLVRGPGRPGPPKARFGDVLEEIYQQVVRDAPAAHP